jgi:hypothetical protein
MPDYKQTSIAGQQWNRFSRIVIDNPRNGSPSVLCVEQEVIALAQGEVIRDIDNLNFPFDPNAQFDILDPATNLPTGQTAIGAEVYALVFSCVMAMAAKRDAALAAAAEAAANPPADPPVVPAP